MREGERPRKFVPRQGEHGDSPSGSSQRSIFEGVPTAGPPARGPQEPPGPGFPQRPGEDSGIIRGGWGVRAPRRGRWRGGRGRAGGGGGGARWGGGLRPRPPARSRTGSLRRVEPPARQVAGNRLSQCIAVERTPKLSSFAGKEENTSAFGG